MNSFNPELHLKDTESAIKNKLKKLFSDLRRFKFVTRLFLVFKKIESRDKIKYDNFYSRSKAERIINESDIVMKVMCLNESILQLHGTYKNL